MKINAQLLFSQPYPPKVMNFSDTKLRPILRFVAVMNLIAGIPFMLAPQIHLEMYYNLTPETTPNILLLYHQMFWAIVIVMGIAYFIMAQNPRGHQGILLIGGAGKLIAVLGWAHALYHYNANMIAWIGIVWDGFWGVFFVLLLWQYYREGASTLVLRDSSVSVKNE